MVFLRGWWGEPNNTREEMSAEDRAFLYEVRKAREEWQAAQNYFDSVDDPDLVDFAIYEVEAARRKYMYLLKQARLRGLQETHFTM